MDGARGHYWAMRSDPVTHLILKGEVVKVSSQTALAYGRRAVLLQRMLETLNKMAGATFTPIQKKELQTWYNNMSEVRESVSYIMYATYREAILQQGIGAINLIGCPSLVEGIRRDISSGRAKIHLN